MQVPQHGKATDMAAALSMKFVPSASPSIPKTLGLDDIPADVKEQCEEVYKLLKENPNGRVEAAFETKQAMLQFITMATAYCSLRPNGAIRFRKSPARGLAENVMQFRITDPLTESDAATEAIRDATATANGKAPAKKAAKATAK